MASTPENEGQSLNRNTDRQYDEHETQSKTNDAQHEDVPPPYIPSSSPSTPASLGVALRPTAPQAQLYILPGITVTADEMSCTAVVPNPGHHEIDVLQSLFMQQAELPPKPVISLRGEHVDTSGRKKVDFDFKINLTNLVMGDSAYMSVPSPAGLERSGGGEKSRFQSLGDENDARLDNLLSWIRTFCSSRAEYKSLSLTREIINLDQTYISGRLRSVIDSTNYRGKVDIKFATLYSEFRIINKPFPLKNSLDPTAAFQSLGAWLGKVVGGRRDTKAGTASTSSDVGRMQEIHAAKCVWPFASVPLSQPGRKVTVQSETEWLKKWEGVVRNAILNGQTGGWLSDDDCMSFMAGVGIAKERKMDWGGDWK